MKENNKETKTGSHSIANNILQNKQNGKSLPAVSSTQLKPNSIVQKVEEDELLQGKFTAVQKVEEEELLQGKFTTVQRVEEKELLQGKFDTVQKVEEEELLQGKFTTVQRVEEEELLQGKFTTIQKVEEEELLQGKFTTVQRVQEEELLQGKFDTVQKVEEEELLQGKFATVQMAKKEKALQGKFGTIQQQDTKAGNTTGMPDNLKAGIENLSGMDMSDVKVNYNSTKPAQLNALAYAQGNNIEMGPGSEQHLGHEAWHVVQQRQGRVQPTKQMKTGVAVNDDPGLEHEADVMGAKALQMYSFAPAVQSYGPSNNVAQLMPIQFGLYDYVAGAVTGAKDMAANAYSSLTTTVTTAVDNKIDELPSGIGWGIVKGVLHKEFKNLRDKGLKGLIDPLLKAGDEFAIHQAKKYASGTMAVLAAPIAAVAGPLLAALTAFKAILTAWDQLNDNIKTGLLFTLGMITAKLPVSDTHALQAIIVKGGNGDIRKTIEEWTGDAQGWLASAQKIIAKPVTSLFNGAYNLLYPESPENPAALPDPLFPSDPKATTDDDEVKNKGKMISFKHDLLKIEVDNLLLGFDPKIPKKTPVTPNLPGGGIRGGIPNMGGSGMRGISMGGSTKARALAGIAQGVINYGYAKTGIKRTDKPGMIVKFSVQLCLFDHDIPKRGDGNVKDTLFVPFAGGIKFTAGPSIILNDTDKELLGITLGHTEITPLVIEDGVITKAGLNIAKIKIGDFLTLAKSSVILNNKLITIQTTAALNVAGFNPKGNVKLVLNNGTFQSLDINNGTDGGNFELTELHIESGYVGNASVLLKQIDLADGTFTATNVTGTGTVVNKKIMGFGFGAEKIGLNGFGSNVTVVGGKLDYTAGNEQEKVEKNITASATKINAEIAGAVINLNTITFDKAKKAYKLESGSIIFGDLKINLLEASIIDGVIEIGEASVESTLLGKTIKGTIKTLTASKKGGVDWVSASVNLDSLTIGSLNVTGLNGTLNGKSKNYSYTLSTKIIDGLIGDNLSFSSNNIGYDSETGELSADEASAKITLLDKTITGDIKKLIASKHGVAWDSASVTLDSLTIGSVKGENLEGTLNDKRKDYSYTLEAETFAGSIAGLSFNGQTILYDSATGTLSADEASAGIKLLDTQITGTIKKLTASKKDGVDWTSAGLSAEPKTLKFGDHLSFVLPSIEMKGQKEKYLLSIVGASGELHFGEYVDAKGTGNISWNFYEKKTPEIESADLDLKVSSGKSIPGGYVPVWPFSITFDFPIPPAYVGFGFNLGGGVELGASGTVNYEKPGKLKFNATATATGTLTFGVTLQAGIGHPAIVALEAQVMAEAAAAAEAKIIIDGEANKGEKGFDFSEITANYELSATLKASINAAIKARALYFFNKTLYEVKLAEWDLGKAETSGAMGIFNGIPNNGTLGEGFIKKPNSPFQEAPIEEKDANQLLLAANAKIIGSGEKREEILKGLTKDVKDLATKYLEEHNALKLTFDANMKELAVIIIRKDLYFMEKAEKENLNQKAEEQLLDEFDQKHKLDEKREAIRTKADRLDQYRKELNKILDLMKDVEAGLTAINLEAGAGENPKNIEVGKEEVLKSKKEHEPKLASKIDFADMEKDLEEKNARKLTVDVSFSVWTKAEFEKISTTYHSTTVPFHHNKGDMTKRIEIIPVDNALGAFEAVKGGTKEEQIAKLEALKEAIATYSGLLRFSSRMEYVVMLKHQVVEALTKLKK